jgi:hypothetical protein
VRPVQTFNGFAQRLVDDVTSIKVHLDTDIGGDIDDLCALAMLLAWEVVDLVGVTTAAEDRGRRAGDATRALAIVGWLDIPVAAGADVATGCFRFAQSYPSEPDYRCEPVPALPGPSDAALDLLAANIAGGATVIAIRALHQPGRARGSRARHTGSPAAGADGHVRRAAASRLACLGPRLGLQRAARHSRRGTAAHPCDRRRIREAPSRIIWSSAA